MEFWQGTGGVVGSVYMGDELLATTKNVVIGVFTNRMSGYRESLTAVPY